jgi:hypothetical protein
MMQFQKLFEFIEPLAFIIGVIGVFWNFHYRIKSVERIVNDHNHILKSIEDIKKDIHIIKFKMDERD